MRLSGLNVNAISLNTAERGYVLDLFKRMNSISHTTMDDWGFTEQAASASPASLFGHRAWNPFHVRDDTRTYLEKDPETWAAWVHEFPKKTNVLHHMLNEPTSDDVPRLVDWLIQAMDLTGKNGKYPTRCIVGNLAVDKSFQHIGDSIRWRDEWLRFFRAFERHLDWHVLGLHRYSIADIRLAYVNGYPANVQPEHPNHKDFLDPNKWQLKLERRPTGHLPPHWHGYADLWAKQLCIEHGIQLPREMITEDWLDEKRDPGTQPFIQWMDATYPTEYNNGKMRGIWSYKRWSEAVTGSGYNQALRDQLEAKNTMHMRLERDYPQLRGKQLGTHLFSFTKSPDWEAAAHSVYTPPTPEGKYMERWLLLEDMTQVSHFIVGDTPMPEPIEFDPPLFPAKVSVSSGFWNLRADMRTSSADLGDITTTPTEMQVSKKTNDANGFTWYKFKQTLPTGDIVGYFADTDKLTIEYLADAPDTGDEEPPTDPDAWYQALEQRVDSLETMLDALTTQITDLLTDFAEQTELVIVDVPMPGGEFTYSLPKFALDSEIQRAKGRRLWWQSNEDSLRRANGELLLKDVHEEVFQSATLPSDSAFSNVAHDETVMNPEAEDNETEEGDTNAA